MKKALIFILIGFVIFSLSFVSARIVDVSVSEIEIDDIIMINTPTEISVEVYNNGNYDEEIHIGYRIDYIVNEKVENREWILDSFTIDKNTGVEFLREYVFEEAGNYEILVSISASLYDDESDNKEYKNIFVIGNPLDGKCGDADGKYFENEDQLINAGLCDEGEDINFYYSSSTKKWYWTCEGVNDGDDASCRAYKEEDNYINGWEYTGTNYDISSKAKGPMAISWDGDNWWVAGNSHDKIYKYTSSWNYTGTNYEIEGKHPVPQGIEWDGNNWWVLETNKDMIYKYDKDWAYTGDSYSIASENTYPVDIEWDGKNWWMIGRYGGDVYKYYSNWKYTGTNYNLKSEGNFFSGISWDGDNWWAVEQYRGKVHKYTKSWDYTGISYNLSEDNHPRDIEWDGDNFWMVGSSSPSSVYKYTPCEYIKHYEKKCYNNDVYWYDSNGYRNNKYERCGSLGCEDGECIVKEYIKHYEKKCYNNDVYWYDSNGDRDGKYQECYGLGCEDGVCKTEEFEHDVSVEIDAPSSADIDETVEINAEVSNIGDSNEEDVIVLFYVDDEYKNYKIIDLLKSGKTKTIDFFWTAVEGVHEFLVKVSIVDDENSENDEAESAIYVTEEEIKCYENSDCGTNKYIGSKFCKYNNVYQEWKTYKCNNPGKTSSYCSSSNIDKKREDCGSLGCEDGVCKTEEFEHDVSVEIDAPSSADIDEEVTIDAEVSNIGDSDEEDVIVLFYVDDKLKGNKVIGWLESGKTRTVDFFWTAVEGVHEFLVKALLIGDENSENNEVISEIDVEEEEIDGECGNADGGMFNTKQDLIDTGCLCSEGEATEIYSNNIWYWWCEGENGGSDDFCQAEKGEIECYKDSDCGTDRYVGSKFCKNGDVYQEWKTYKCNNPGKTSSYCSSSNIDKKREDCAYGCLNGACRTEEPEGVCEDSDGGLNYFEQGKARIPGVGGYADCCKNKFSSNLGDFFNNVGSGGGACVKRGDYLYEAYCKNGVPAVKIKECNCYKGKCR